MQQWEYFYKKDAIFKGVNTEELGIQGWELCAIDGRTWIFKRPIGPNWKERCEAAEAVINATNEADGIIAADIWEQIKNKHNAKEKRTNP